MRSKITTRSEWMRKDMSKHQIGRQWYYVLQFIQIKKKQKRKKHKRWENMLIALRNESSCGVMSIVYVLSLFIKQRNVWRQSSFFFAKLLNSTFDFSLKTNFDIFSDFILKKSLFSEIRFQNKKNSKSLNYGNNVQKDAQHSDSQQITN